MEKVKKYFGEFNMTWPRVILLAIITAVYTALINQVSFLKDTSFQDIAIYADCWILFAVFIVVNCKKWLEAALKCFVFFLVSQPLIYLIEVPFYGYGWDIFRYYDYWFKITLLTLPGAVIAFQLKKKNWLSVVVLSVATGYLSAASVRYFRAAMANFPNHLLSAIFCIALAVFFVFVLLDKKKHRIAALTVIVAVVIAFVSFTGIDKSKEILLDEGSWNYSLEDESVVVVEITEGNHVTLTAKHDGNTSIRFESDEGTEINYYVTVSGGSIWINLLDES
ncbi:hypothetical protein DCE79_16195 [Lysinibacillus sp. 2017]|uniref:hypothetical protein n=1 Tax=unclassified Lysinibacillus TaxID=2636778 RepID=UPI000D5297B4|nr:MULTISPECIES: hypothetical protein [unclassified Lysinibacillus]AWE08801.1 hypothetical protein DCE79_16195 [Lysinibacillus sp. 2017]TGN36124.1 hypothetical protein E4L99_06575 [Lysinibacillus sp. S2017]